MSKPNLVLYHASDADGTASGWIAREALGDTADYVPCYYRKELTDWQDILDLAKGRDRVFFLDFSAPFPIAVKLREMVGEIILLDHHDTPMAQMLGVQIDDDIPGCRLTWNFFKHKAVKGRTDYPQGTTLGEVWRYPYLLDYVAARDRWDWDSLPNCLEVNQGLKEIFPWDIDGFAIAMDMPNVIDVLTYLGKAIYVPKLERTISEALKDIQWISINGQTVPAVHADREISMIGHRLCKIFPDAPFAAIYRTNPRNPEQIKWDLRSENRYDCKLVAKTFGGGGHPNASGFYTDKGGYIGNESQGSFELAKDLKMTGGQDPNQEDPLNPEEKQILQRLKDAYPNGGIEARFSSLKPLGIAERLANREDWLEGEYKVERNLEEGQYQLMSRTLLSGSMHRDGNVYHATADEIDLYHTEGDKKLPKDFRKASKKKINCEPAKGESQFIERALDPDHDQEVANQLADQITEDVNEGSV